MCKKSILETFVSANTPASVSTAQHGRVDHPDAVNPHGSHLEVVGGTSGHSLPNESRMSFHNCFSDKLQESTAVITKYIERTNTVTNHLSNINQIDKQIIKFHLRSICSIGPWIRFLLFSQPWRRRCPLVNPASALSWYQWLVLHTPHR